MNKKQKLILLTCLGSIMEYYDFIIYGMMTIYLSAVFFPNNAREITYLKSFSILSVGYLARPLGGYFFGIIADLYGRKKTLIIVMLLMSLATLMIGFLPTYAQAGITAPIFLTIARILQGLSFGAEIPSMTTLIKEYTQNNRSGKYFGLIMSSTCLGALLASAVVFLMSRYFTQHEIIDWVWRIPFIIGSVLALFILIIRNKIDETPEFLQNKHSALLHDSSKQIMLELCKNNWKGLLLGMSITLVFSFLIIFSLYLPVYINQYFHYSIENIFLTMTMSIVLCVLFSPVFGYIFDRLNRFRVLKITALLFIIFLWGSLQGLQSGSHYALIFFLFGYQIFISAYATNIMAMLPDIFPAHIRSTGVGISYNMAYALASLSPAILTSIIQLHNHQFIVIIFSTCIIAIALAGCILLQPSTVQANLLTRKLVKAQP